MSTIKVTTLQNLSGVEVYTAKAWVQIDQTGTQSVSGSGNVSSITDYAAGSSGMTFANVMPNANYAFFGQHAGTTHNEREYVTGSTNIPVTTTELRLRSLEGGVSNNDHSQFSMGVIA